MTERKNIEGLTAYVVDEKGRTVKLVPEANFTLEKDGHPDVDLFSLRNGWLDAKLPTISREEVEGPSYSAVVHPEWQRVNAIRSELVCSAKHGSALREQIEAAMDAYCDAVDEALKRAGRVG